MATTVIFTANSFILLLFIETVSLQVVGSKHFSDFLFYLVATVPVFCNLHLFKSIFVIPQIYYMAMTFITFCKILNQIICQPSINIYLQKNTLQWRDPKSSDHGI